MAGIWDKVTELRTTPSIDLVNAWNLVDDEWEQFNYDYEDLII